MVGILARQQPDVEGQARVVREPAQELGDEVGLEAADDAVRVEGAGVPSTKGTL